MKEYTSALLPMKAIYMGRNVRLPALMKIAELAADIAENGLLTPILVYEVKPRGFEVIQGHRRLHSIQSLAEEAFEKHFSRGIPVTVVTGVTYDEAQLMKVDHGNEVGLSDPMEIQLCGNILFSQGKSEKEAVIRLAALMDRIKPMKSEKLKKYQTMLADAKLLTIKGMTEEAKAKLKDAEDFLFNYRRGYIQNIHNAWRCPTVVMAALYLKATGTAPEKGTDFFTEQKLPKGITYQHVTSLWKAFEKDLTHKDETGKLKYNKTLPGPDFTAKWNEICTELNKAAEDSESGGTRAKAMSAGDMEKELTEGKWQSNGFQMLTRHHRKEEGVDTARLMALDKLAFLAELLSERAPKEWADAVELAEGIIKIQTEAQTQAVRVEAPARASGGKKK